MPKYHSWIVVTDSTTEDELWDVYGDLVPESLKKKDR